MGGKYIPLRKEFSKMDEKAVRERHVLITTGGTDTYNMAGRVLLECLGRKQWENVAFHVIVGSMNSHQAELQILAEGFPCVHLHKNVTNMSDYMRRCKVAVSAGGRLCMNCVPVAFPRCAFPLQITRSRGRRLWGSRA